MSRRTRVASEPPVIRLVQELVRIPSPSGEEREAASFLMNHLEEQGLRPVREGDNVYAIAGVGPPWLLLASHLDTVPAGTGWTRDPLSGVVENGFVHGRGAVDAKSSVAAMAWAVILHARRSRAGRGGVIFAATAEEETGGKGLSHLLPLLPPIDHAVVGEPTGLRVSTAQKGMLILRLRASGEGGHAARPVARHAARVLAEDLLALEDVRFPRTSALLGRVSVVPTVIQGGTRNNVIPSEYTCVLDVRTIPEYTVDEIRSAIASAVRSEVDVVSSRYGACETPAGSWVRECALAIAGGEPVGSDTTSDWVFLGDVPAVKWGPGESRWSHAPDERVSIGEVVRAVRCYFRLCRRFAGEGCGAPRSSAAAGADPGRVATGGLA